MITEEKKKALEELNRMIEQFADEHGIEVLAATSVTERGEENTSQAVGVVLIGTTEYLILAIIGCIRSNPTIKTILTTAVNCADEVEYNKFNVIKR